MSINKRMSARMNMKDIIEALKEISELWWLTAAEKKQLLEAIHAVTVAKQSIDERTAALNYKAERDYL